MSVGKGHTQTKTKQLQGIFRFSSSGWQEEAGFFPPPSPSRITPVSTAVAVDGHGKIPKGMKEWWGGEGKEKKKHEKGNEITHKRVEEVVCVCVCVCWWWCKKKAPPRSYRSWPQSRTHITHRSKARETCGFLCCPGDPGQIPSRRFSKAKRQKGRHTHTLILIGYARQDKRNLLNKNKNLYSFFFLFGRPLFVFPFSVCFKLLLSLSFFPLSFVVHTHTHTHTHTRHLMPFVDSPRLLVLTISPFHLVRFLLFHRATTYSIYLSISILLAPLLLLHGIRSRCIQQVFFLFFFFVVCPASTLLRWRPAFKPPREKESTHKQKWEKY